MDNFRIALSLGLNRKRIIDDFYSGNGEPYQAAPRPESPFYNERLAKQYTEYIPDLAAEYLDKISHDIDNEGHRLGVDGKPIKFTIIAADLFGKSWPLVLEYIKEDWWELGVEIEIEIMDWENLDQQRNYANTMR